MAETIRLNKVLRELNISIDRAVEFLQTHGIEIEKRPTTKITSEIYAMLSDEFQSDANKKVASIEVIEAKQKEKEALLGEMPSSTVKAEPAKPAENVVKARQSLVGLKQVGKIDLNPPKKEEPVAPVSKEPVKEKPAPL